MLANSTINQSATMYLVVLIIISCYKTHDGRMYNITPFFGINNILIKTDIDNSSNTQLAEILKL